jgi:hypothetical protein
MTALRWLGWGYLAAGAALLTLVLVAHAPLVMER